MESIPTPEGRANTLANLYVVVPHIVQTCPDLDDWGVLDLIREKTRSDYLDPEDVQSIRALYLRTKLAAAKGRATVRASEP